MAKYIPNRSFLVRQDELADGKKKDVIAKKGEKMELTDREAVKFWGGLQLNDSEKKRLNALARTNKYTRAI